MSESEDTKSPTPDGDQDDVATRRRMRVALTFLGVSLSTYYRITGATDHADAISWATAAMLAHWFGWFDVLKKRGGPGP